MLSKLPVDLSTFGGLRKQKYLYIDKTKYAYDLITGGHRFFLSRPRRFGKTILISTLKEILLANRELFKDLWIDTSDYTWQKNGVITLDLSGLGIRDADTLQAGLKEALLRVAREYGITIDMAKNTPEFILYDLVEELKTKFGRVALLIDEYDSPILHALKEPEQAFKIRDGLKIFFATIKSLDIDLDFVFITGVSSFAKAGLFSGLNNLQVISIDDRYATICGYTQQEVEHYFRDHIQAWATKENIDPTQLLGQIKHWYNGYKFSRQSQSVYNPFSLMKAFEVQLFKNFWFQSGTPAFLIEELKNEYRKKEYRLLDLDNLVITEDTLGIFDVGATPLPSLMFQTGYLTIVNYDRNNDSYVLGFPNFEVKSALQKNILAIFAKIDFAAADQISNQLKMALNKGEVKEVVRLFKQLFLNIPYQLHIKEEFVCCFSGSPLEHSADGVKKFYHALFQIICDAMGIKAQSEYSTSHGRIDLKLEVPNWIYVIEIKFNKNAEEALKQIEDMKYYESFTKEKKPIILLGLCFHRSPKFFDITYKEKHLSAINS